MSRRRVEVLEFVATHQPVTLAQVAQHFQISANTAGNHLQALRQAERAWATNNNRWAKWVTVKPVKPLPHKKPTPQPITSIWALADASAD